MDLNYFSMEDYNMTNLNLLVKKAANIHYKWETEPGDHGQHGVRGTKSRDVYLKKMDECYTLYREAGGDLMEFDRQFEKELLTMYKQ